MNLAITVRFGKKDGDLMLMVSQYRISDMLVLAVDRHLGKTKESIPLPPNVPYKPIHCATIYLNDEHEDAINFMRQFPNGYRSAAVKMLLRHAMERCDLRHLLEPGKAVHEKPAIPKRDYLKPARKSVPAKDSQAGRIEHPDITSSPIPHNEDDDIFNLI